MGRKTHFESQDDVEAYFAAQVELWNKPKPRAPRRLCELIEKARLLKMRRHVEVHHEIAKPNFSRLEFPKISKPDSTHRVKTIHKIAGVPKIRAAPLKSYEIKNISSLRDLLSTRWHET